MDMMAGAIGAILVPEVFVTMLLASCFGIFLGSIPGLTATMGAALLVPITFFMDPLPAIAAVVAVATSAIFAGDLPGAFLRIPGTPASAAYSDDAYAYTRDGRAIMGLGMGLVAALLGGLIGTAVLIWAGPLLAQFALGFSSAEYFWLALLGLSCAVIVSGADILKGMASLFIGLFVACVGVDVIAGHPRFTFGTVELMGGVSFIPALIGLFALSELMRNITFPDTMAKSAIPEQKKVPWIGKVLGEIFRGKLLVIRGGFSGTMIGALPGAGADIAAWISYAISKRFSRTPEKFGKGHSEGIIEAGASNNGALAGAWVPALVFGIPGDTITAIAIGILMAKGIQPGPTIFLFQPDLMAQIFAAFLVANLLLLPVGLSAIFAGSYLLRVSRRILLPIILLFCVVGSFGVEGSVWGIGIMLVFGVLGWLMVENDIPLAPAILGIVLGEMIEFNFVTSLMKANGDPAIFVTRPISAVLACALVLLWLFPLVKWLRDRKRASAAG